MRRPAVSPVPSAAAPHMTDGSCFCRAFCQFRCFNNVNRFRNSENTLPSRSAGTSILNSVVLTTEFIFEILKIPHLRTVCTVHGVKTAARRANVLTDSAAHTANGALTAPTRTVGSISEALLPNSVVLTTEFVFENPENTHIPRSADTSNAVSAHICLAVARRIRCCPSLHRRSGTCADVPSGGTPRLVHGCPRPHSPLRAPFSLIPRARRTAALPPPS